MFFKNESNDFIVQAVVGSPPSTFLTPYNLAWLILHIYLKETKPHLCPCNIMQFWFPASRWGCPAFCYWAGKLPDEKFWI